MASRHEAADRRTHGRLGCRLRVITRPRPVARRTRLAGGREHQHRSGRIFRVNSSSSVQLPSASPDLPADLIPRHIALVMDGNGRWARERGLPRTEGHKRGEAVLMDAVDGCLEAGVNTLSAYAFSTENWRRSPEEVRFIMGFSRRVLHDHRDELDAKGVRIRWIGRRPRLWRVVIRELEKAEAQTVNNTRMTLNMCINYGGRAEIADAMKLVAEKVQSGEICLLYTSPSPRD